MRRAARVDDNHGEIVNAFKACGFVVRDTSAVGDGFPDLVCSRAGRTILVEIKDGKKPPSARKLTEAQIEFHSTWRGTIYIVSCLEDVMQAARSEAALS